MVCVLSAQRTFGDGRHSAHFLRQKWKRRQEILYSAAAVFIWSMGSTVQTVVFSHEVKFWRENTSVFAFLSFLFPPNPIRAEKCEKWYVSLDLFVL
jgi:hypothetical protein